MVGALFVAGLAFAQPRITSFTTDGELTWTNYIYRGFYTVEAGSKPAGPWNTLASVVDSDWARTNRITLQVPVTNTPTFYRVAWMLPDPVGVWDYRGYDNQGTLVLTGQLSIPAITLLTSDPPVVYGVEGSWNLQYAGPPTNAFGWLGPQIGTGSFGGTLESHAADLTLIWPTNVRDNNIRLARDLWSNTYTGQWSYIGFGPISAGTFTATRMPSTNLAGQKLNAREVGNSSDNSE